MKIYATAVYILLAAALILVIPDIPIFKKILYKYRSPIFIPAFILSLLFFTLTPSSLGTYIWSITKGIAITILIVLIIICFFVPEGPLAGEK